jgi:cell division protein FtsX
MLDFRMASVTFIRAAKRGVVSIFREEGWGMALGSLFGVLLIGQLLCLLAVGVHGGLELLKERTDLRLQIRESATDAQIQDLFQNVRELSYVDDVVYITKEQAFERQKLRDPTLIEFLSKFGIENPFPDTMGVRLKHLSDYDAFVQFLKQPVFTAVVDPAFLSDTTDQQQQVTEIANVVSASRTVLLFTLGLVVAVLLFVVVELIRRRALVKREELFVEQLVGAGRMDILLPFMIEMAFLLLSALLLSVLCMAIVVILLPVFLPALAAGGMFAQWSAMSASLLAGWFPWILIAQILLMVVLSALGTVLALRSQSVLSLT